jgi:ABC-type spermidine/putrescine transport system permease subunit I
MPFIAQLIAALQRLLLLLLLLLITMTMMTMAMTGIELCKLNQFMSEIRSYSAVVKKKTIWIIGFQSCRMSLSACSVDKRSAYSIYTWE